MSRGTGIITNVDELVYWQAAVEQATGDPAARTALLCFPYFNFMLGLRQCEFGAYFSPNGLQLFLDEDIIPIEFQEGQPVVDSRGELKAFGMEKLSPRTWALSPSLNVPGMIHGFVVLHNVPDPAPWERLIVVVPG